MREVTKIMFPILTIAVFLSVLMVSQGISIAGDLEPSGTPGSTMKTLDQIPPTWSQRLLAAERFEPVLGSAGVLDKETGLVWQAFPSTTPLNWSNAILHCYQLSTGSCKGWRLPTVEELGSLVDPTKCNPALPSGHPFLDVYSDYYWSATTSANDTTNAWGVSMYGGDVDYGGKTSYGYVWCVRGGHGYDAY